MYYVSYRYEHNLHIDGVIYSKMLLRMVSYNYGSLWPTLYLPGIDFGMGHDLYICFSTSLGMVWIRTWEVRNQVSLPNKTHWGKTKFLVH